MEIMLLILAATYAVSGKHQKDTAVSAYKAGKEPPGLVKARLRHEAGGGKVVSRPGKKDKPKGPGATRLLIAQRWAGACEKARIRGEDKLARWQAWYQEQAPQRDEAWRAKQRQKLQNRADRLAKWQGRWNSAKDMVTGKRGEGSTSDASTGTDQAGETTSPTTDPPAKPAADEQSPSGLEDQAGQAGNTTQGTETADENTQNAEEAENADSSEDTSQATESEEPEKSEGAKQGTSNGGGNPAAGASTTPIGDLVDYQQGAATLHNHADEVDGYDTALTGLGQDMESVNWGAEVHGELTEMHSQLASIAARYRDLAEQVKAQGDAVNDAYDEAPWAPDRHVLTQ